MNMCYYFPCKYIFSLALFPTTEGIAKNKFPISFYEEIDKIIRKFSSKFSIFSPNLWKFSFRNS